MQNSACNKRGYHRTYRYVSFGSVKIVLKPFHVQHKLSMAPSDNTIVRSYHRGEGKATQLMLNPTVKSYNILRNHNILFSICTYYVH